jgi:hypothetical protein
MFSRKIVIIGLALAALMNLQAMDGSKKTISIKTNYENDCMYRAGIICAVLYFYNSQGDLTPLAYIASNNNYFFSNFSHQKTGQKAILKIGTEEKKCYVRLPLESKNHVTDLKRTFPEIYHQPLKNLQDGLEDAVKADNHHELDLTELEKIAKTNTLRLKPKFPLEEKSIIW